MTRERTEGSVANVTIAVEGCCHGELPSIYRYIHQLEERNSYKIDLLLVCGDFQAIRNHSDLECMAVPDKYKALGDFHRPVYYTGELTAPVPTIVIGGNHEASNYLWELYHGGWLAPNIYFLGHAGCVQVNGVRIAGASGIFKSHDYVMGRSERVPYNRGSMRSIYHTREFDIRRLSMLTSPNIFMSHDWPAGIEHFGNFHSLMRRKPHFRSDSAKGELGSPAHMDLLKNLKPQWWFSAHLHVRFEAEVVHGTDATPTAPSAPTVATNPDEITIDDEDQIPSKPGPNTGNGSATESTNPDEITLDDEEVDVAPPPAPSAPPLRTRFLALDKCLPQRQFLEVDQVVDVQTPEEYAGAPIEITYDPEWLAITRAFHPLFSTTAVQPLFPPPDEAWQRVKGSYDWVQANLSKHFDDPKRWLVSDVQKFTAVALGGPVFPVPKGQQPPFYANPQTDALCRMLELENKITR
ncbi:lariat debranching enzyme, C-terminal domain-containing protein [Vararia minispora EC-137]|uniref:Lariat debranching enzyme, C-terminal domain-containing protein n=1 Tax=Vararia minispora EC-137 TaxID=1314806 RepID=A0ACB8QJC5_9AGAM|nr:lariat debranching enzyme, C-terminal domain-containing protein [Vararia minispora EC-137]